MRYFELNTTRQIVPDTGEQLGVTLALLAERREAELREGPGSVEYWAGTVAQLLYLAADAFCAGAGASIGHKRSDRYEQRAQELRAQADTLYAEGRSVRDEREGALSLAAFDDGYAGRDISRYSFDKREAAIVGQLYAKEGRAMPQQVRYVYQPRPLGRDSERDHLLVDGERYVVDYPTGKVTEATVERLA